MGADEDVHSCGLSAFSEVGWSSAAGMSSCFAGSVGAYLI
jgi:hypothetical protein